jgi:dihydrolipoamide dehydrogenase
MYDLLIIGGGPAGYLAGERAGAAGLKTAVIEKREVGGTCLNEGCVPSKTFLNSAKIYDHAIHGAGFGVNVSGASINQSAIVQRKNNVVKMLVGGVMASLQKNNAELIKGTAKIAGKTDDGFKVDVDGTEYVGKQLLIASGSEAVVPPIPGVKEALESGFAMTNREILDLEVIPESLVIIGGGVIGLEMASYFGTVGSKVTVIEMLDKIAGPTEKEISKILQGELRKKGIVFKLGCKVTAVEENKVIYEKDGKQEEAEADKVLLSIGRKAHTADLGLESIGVQTERGVIITDEYMRTNVDGVYATGDVNGKIMLAHTAYRESEVAINNITGKTDIMKYNAVPSVIYGDPEAAGVGETLESALEKGIDAVEVKLPMVYSGRYVAETERGKGICKLIVDQAKNTLVGVHMIGSYCSEIIYGAAIMIENEMTIDEIKKTVFPHPSVSEIIRETLFEI